MVSSLARGNRLDLPFNQSCCHFLSLLHCMLCPVSQVLGEVGAARFYWLVGWLVSGTVRDSILPLRLNDFLFDTTFPSPVCRNERQLEPR